ncbi:protein SHQ1 homolog [Leptodactylus fuscus]|uniref:protein SHQ1 homolog n=1 Tax=Leptodactylus fuscus TaxID=238119 RepID=UPI003F4EAF46
MITPAFNITQDSDFLVITINVPYARVSEFDIYIDGYDFKFYAKPYFLRLSLPEKIVEDGRQKATYNADDGIFTVQVPKETPGQQFEGLDLLTSLLAPKGTRTCKPLIEEIGSANEDPEDDEEEFDWQIEQTPYEEPSCDALNSPCSYGFGNLRSGVFRRLQEELNDVIDLRDPDVTPASERTQRRLAAEKAKFDPDHYLADLYEDEAIQPLLKYKPWWKQIQKGASAAANSQNSAVKFTEKEKQLLQKFPNKSYVLDKRSEQLAYLSLIDLLLAYSYEIRVTEGERNVESAWTIRKLSGTLCWFENYTSVKDVLVSFGRRVLCYPLYRNFQLVTKAIQDTCALLSKGKAAVLKCLLDIHEIFQENDPAYILNDLYITDYCVWIQKIKSKKVTGLSDCLQATTVSKADLGLELEELEEAAALVQEEEKLLEASDNIPRQPAALVTSQAPSSSDSSETEQSTSDEEDESVSEEDIETLHAEAAAPLIQVVDNTEPQPVPTSAPLKAPAGTEEKAQGAATNQESPIRHHHDNQDTTDCAPCTEPKHQTREYLEVAPKMSRLQIVEGPAEDEDTLLSVG